MAFVTLFELPSWRMSECAPVVKPVAGSVMESPFMLPDASVVGVTGLVTSAVEVVVSRNALTTLPLANPPALRLNVAPALNWLFGNEVTRGLIVIVVCALSELCVAVTFSDPATTPGIWHDTGPTVPVALAVGLQKFTPPTLTKTVVLA